MHTTRAYSKPIFFKFYRFLFFGVPLLETLSGCRKNQSSLGVITNNDSREQIEQLTHLHNQISKSTLLYDNKRLLKLKGELKVLYNTFKKSALPAQTYEKPRFCEKTLGFIAQKFCYLQYIFIITAECSCGDIFFQCAKTWGVVFYKLIEDIFYNLYKKQRRAKAQQVRFSAFPTTAVVCGVKSVRNTKSKIWCSSISSRFESSSNFILRFRFCLLPQHSRLGKMFGFRYAISS